MVTQLYRDRGDSENNFDELKNQWAWSGFTTQDRKRCQIMARLTALIYNWWTVFMRLGIPERHAEAITSRPLALHGIARQTRHANQTTVEITSTHAMAPVIQAALTKISGFFKTIKPESGANLARSVAECPLGIWLEAREQRGHRSSATATTRSDPARTDKACSSR